MFNLSYVERGKSPLGENAEGKKTQQKTISKRNWRLNETHNGSVYFYLHKKNYIYKNTHFSILFLNENKERTKINHNRKIKTIKQTASWLK
jgi:hypothetical protein